MLPVKIDENSGAISSRVYARIGLLGNPSDGYYGRCISICIENYYAEVYLEPSNTIEFKPNPDSDPRQFKSLSTFTDYIDGNGYYGGVRLLMAAVKQFSDYCKQHDITIPNDKAFKLSYQSQIPRQRGLSGSSALILSTINCLIAYYNLENRIPVEDRPLIALDAETSLGIIAGLQDRIIQVYGGALYMDFAEDYMAKHAGHPYLETLDAKLLPGLYLIYDANNSSGKDSGKVHSAVRERWLARDSLLVGKMGAVASLADLGRVFLLESKNPETNSLESMLFLMNRNFDLRRQMFGDEAIGSANLKMIELARRVGAAAKFCGSGGAIVACCETEEQTIQLQRACRDNNIECEKVRVGPVHYQVENLK